MLAVTANCEPVLLTAQWTTTCPSPSTAMAPRLDAVICWPPWVANGMLIQWGPGKQSDPGVVVATRWKETAACAAGPSGRGELVPPSPSLFFEGAQAAAAQQTRVPASRACMFEHRCR